MRWIYSATRRRRRAKAKTKRPRCWMTANESRPLSLSKFGLLPLSLLVLPPALSPRLHHHQRAGLFPPTLLYTLLRRRIVLPSSLNTHHSSTMRSTIIALIASVGLASAHMTLQYPPRCVRISSSAVVVEFEGALVLARGARYVQTVTGSYSRVETVGRRRGTCRVQVVSRQGWNEGETARNRPENRFLTFSSSFANSHQLEIRPPNPRNLDRLLVHRPARRER
jgi:hypothetical protein